MRRFVLASLWSLAGALLLAPALAVLGDRDLALLAATGLTAPIAGALARSPPWVVPLVTQAFAWAVVVAFASPLVLDCSREPCEVREGVALSPWLALVSPLALGCGIALALALERARRLVSGGGGRDQGPEGRSTTPRRGG